MYIQTYIPIMLKITIPETIIEQTKTRKPFKRSWEKTVANRNYFIGQNQPSGNLGNNNNTT
jgi:membrane-anchored glycerophosphoryl diester phosphodiesterase (GDPDase)